MTTTSNAIDDLCGESKRRLGRLSDDWQPLTALKLSPTEGDYYFRDLRDRGLAIERRTPLFRFGIQVGETIEYRKSTPADTTPMPEDY